MSPREYPPIILRWMKSYIQHLGLENPSEISDIVWKCAEYPCPSHTLDKYGAKILLPLAHALVHMWKGRDSITAFSVFARRFGLASLEYISWLQVYGLDDTYGDALRDVWKGEKGLYAIAQEFVDRRGYSVWMACTAGYDVLYEHLPKVHSVSGSSLKGVQLVISNARFLVQNISSERFQYLNLVTKERILDEAKAIVKDFGNL